MNPTFCRHILPTTRKCQSPALTGKLYCHYHARLYRRGSGFHAANLLPRRVPTLQLPDTLPTTPAAIQARITLIIQALTTGGIDPRRASACLFALQQIPGTPPSPDLTPIL